MKDADSIVAPLFRYLERKKMAPAKKTIVKFVTGDAPKPQKIAETSAIALRLPFPLSLHPGAKVNVRLGIKCNINLVLGSTKLRLDKYVFLAGEEINLTGEASVTTDTQLDTGERIAVATPLLPDFELE